VWAGGPISPAGAGFCLKTSANRSRSRVRIGWARLKQTGFEDVRSGVSEVR